MPAWNVEDKTPRTPRNATIRYEKDGRGETFEFETTKTLFDAVKEIADTKGLTAVNVLVDGLEVSEQEGKKTLSA